jgi:hypothetical protein
MVRDFSSLSLELITDRALEKNCVLAETFLCFNNGDSFEPMMLGDHADGW